MHKAFPSYRHIVRDNALQEALYYVVEADGLEYIQSKKDMEDRAICRGTKEFCLYYMKSLNWINVDLMRNGRMASWSSKEIE